MELFIDHGSAVPLHYQIEELLREIIKKEEYKKGKLLPTEIFLAEQLGTSRNTVRQAINKLVSEGLLIRKKGVGTVVAPTRVYTKVTNWFSFTYEMKSRDLKVKNYEIKTEWVTPPIEVASFFKISQKIKVLKLERLRGSDEYPFVYFISYFNPKIHISENEDFTLPLYEILEYRYGYRAKLSQEELSASVAGSFYANKLLIKNESPILVRKRFVYDINNLPLEYNNGFYRGDSFVYTLESERKFDDKNQK